MSKKIRYFDGQTQPAPTCWVHFKRVKENVITFNIKGYFCYGNANKSGGCSGQNLDFAR